MAGQGPDTSYRKPPRDRGCCSINFLKYVLFIFNFIFLLGGCAVLGVAIWTLLEKQPYTVLLRTGLYAAIPFLLLLAGIIVIFAALLACCAILREDRCYLLVYTFLLLLVFLLEAGGGVMAYVYEEQVMDSLSRSLTSTFNGGYMEDPEVTKAVDSMQKEYHCCGAQIFSEWQDSTWMKKNQSLNVTVPDSCCKTPSPYCGVRDHPSNIWYTGCIHQFKDELSRQLLILGAVGCGICLIQIFGMILSCCLYVKLKDVDDNYY
ncbi:CD151 antigen-like [Panulirus ornatus]|uniref:CD151 antigen-like n=1 Tax=Panulirus ornatus TaxID=150431 RepID=UPI003A8C3B8F